MFCHNCGAPLADTAAFCGQCGTRCIHDPALRQFQFLKYDAQYAKAHRTQFSFGAMFAEALIYAFCPLLLLIIDIDLIAAVMLLYLITITLLIVRCTCKRKYVLARQSAVCLRKDDQSLYYITFFTPPAVGFSTATRAAAAVSTLQQTTLQMQRAQADRYLHEAMENFCSGTLRYNIWTGGPCRVLRLSDRRPYRHTPRFFRFHCTDQKGRDKKLVIPNCFPGLEELL